MNTYKKLTFTLAKRLAAPHTWPASVLPAVFGCTYCIFKGYPLSVFEIAGLVAASVLMQSSVNTLNDYFDFVKGTDSLEDNLERNDAVLVYEGVNPRSALRLGLLYLAIATILGFVLILTKNTFIPMWIGIIGALAVCFYSGGRTPISYLPIGEFVSGFVMGGLIPLACVALATKEWHFEVLIFASPLIISIGLILMSNNGCDIEKDIRAGRRTLPVLLGREKTKKLYKSLIVIWVVLSVLLSILITKNNGFLCSILIFLLAGNQIQWLMKSPLDQEHRIMQMKTILKANILVNTSYILALAAGIINNAAVSTK